MKYSTQKQKIPSNYYNFWLTGIILFLFFLAGTSLMAQDPPVRKAPQNTQSADQSCATYAGACKTDFCKYVSAKEKYDKVVNNPPKASSEEEELKINKYVVQLRNAYDNAHRKYSDCYQKSLNAPKSNKQKDGGGTPADNNTNTEPPDPNEKTPPPKPVADSDGDGIDDNKDACPGTPKGISVDPRGCPYQNKLQILSPAPGTVYKVQSSNEGLHVTLDVRVTAANNDLYYTEVSYFGSEGAQGDGISLAKSGGTGKGSVLVTGPGTYNFTVTAKFESGPPLQQTIQVKVEMDAPALGALKKLHQTNKKSIEAAREKIRQAKDKNEALIAQELIEIDLLIEDMDKTIKDIDQKWEELESLPAETTTANAAEVEAIEEIKEDLSNWSDEIDEWEEWLSLVDELDEIEEAFEIIELADLGESATIQTAPDEQKVVYSEVDDVYLLINGKGEILNTLDTRGTFVRIIDGNIGFYKDLYYKGKDAVFSLKRLITGSDYTNEEIIEYVNRTMEDPMRNPLIINGQYVEVISMNSGFELAVDPVSGKDMISVFHGPVAVKSFNGQFEDQILESHSTLVVGKEGMISHEHNSRSLMVTAEKHRKILGGYSPMELQHNGRPKASFDIMPKMPKVGETIVIVNNSVDPENDPIQLEWFINGAHRPDLSKQFHFEFDDIQKGPLLISMTATDQYGGRDSFSESIFVEGEGVSSEDLLTPRNIAIGLGALLLLLILINRKKA